jgi:hydrogenase expression/formation protein HypC
MCLGVPGQLTRWLERESLSATAEIDFGGVIKRCHMACVPEAQAGDYVLVHAGVALTVIDRAAAEQILTTLAAVVDPPDNPELS